LHFISLLQERTSIAFGCTATAKAATAPSAAIYWAEAQTHLIFLQGVIFMKSKRFNFRVSDTMDALIRKKAADAGMSITDYIVLCAIDKKVINYDGLRDLTTQVKKLGNNVNQLLILSRQGRISTVNLTATQEELKKIYELLFSELGRG